MLVWGKITNRRDFDTPSDVSSSVEPSDVEQRYDRSVADAEKVISQGKQARQLVYEHGLAWETIMADADNYKRTMKQ